MLSHLALATLVLATNPQAPKRHKKTKAAPAAATSPATPSAPPQGPNVLRTAPCVLTLKGTLKRVNEVPRLPKRGAPAGAATTTSEVSEQFDYELPGTLSEEAGPKGSIRFRFIPATDLNAAGARGSLHFQDNGAGAGGTPMDLLSSELTSADPFVFQASGRGQGLAPVSGLVYVRARLQGPLPPGSPVSMEAPIRPVISVPLPPMQTKMNQSGTSALRFQGISLWAWANSKEPFTVSSTMDYQGLTGVGNVTGSVEVTFRLGATK